MSLIKPLLQDEAFIKDVNSVNREDANFEIWWLGQSGFLIHFRGKYVLLDPYLSDSLTKKYEHTDKPHVRMSERVVAPEALDFISAITSSHNHTDHLDGETLTPLLEKNPGAKLIIPEANRDFVCQRLKCDFDFPVGLAQGDHIMIDDFDFHAVPAAHNEVTLDGKGRCHHLGYVIQFGDWTLYHSGDTLRYKEMVSWLAPFQIDVALLPINGNLPERRVAGNLDGREAAQLARDIGASMVIPCHYDMFTFNTASPDLFAQTCRELNQSFSVLQAGERWESDDLVH